MNLTIFKNTGLTREDTILFDDQKERDAWLLTHNLVRALASEPFLTESFKVKMDYIEALECDYIQYKREVNGKVPKSMYYFIDEVKQVSDGVVEFKVGIDTVNTFMEGDIRIASAKLVKETTLENVPYTQNVTELVKNYTHHDIFKTGIDNTSIVPLVAIKALSKKGEALYGDEYVEGRNILPFSVRMTYVDLSDLSRVLWCKIGDKTRKMPTYKEFLDYYNQPSSNLIDLFVLPFYNIMPDKIEGDELLFSFSPDTSLSTIRTIELDKISEDTGTKYNAIYRNAIPTGEVVAALMAYELVVKYVANTKDVEVRDRPFTNSLVNNSSLKEGFVSVEGKHYPLYSPNMVSNTGSLISNVVLNTKVVIRERPYFYINTNIIDKSSIGEVFIEHPIGSSVVRPDTEAKNAIQKAELQAMVSGIGSVLALVGASANPLIAVGASTSLASLSYNTNETVRVLRKEMARMTGDLIQIDYTSKERFVPKFIIGEVVDRENKLKSFVYRGVVVDKEVSDYKMGIDNLFGVKYYRFSDVIIDGNIPRIFKNDLKSRLENGIRLWKKEDFLNFYNVNITQNNHMTPIKSREFLGTEDEII